MSEIETTTKVPEARVSPKPQKRVKFAEDGDNKTVSGGKKRPLSKKAAFYAEGVVDESLDPKKLICRYCKEPGHKIVACPKVPCRRCHYIGHTSENCLTKICAVCSGRGHMAETCYDNVCSKCGYRGHSKDECRTRMCTICGKVGHESDKCYQNKEIHCDRCGKFGHVKDDCKTKMFCNYCKKDGSHFISKCPQIICRNCDDNHFTDKCPYVTHQPKKPRYKKKESFETKVIKDILDPHTN